MDIYGYLMMTVITITVLSNGDPIDNFTTTFTPILASPCSTLGLGDVDFQMVDLIAVYRLDRSDTTGVTLVQGSQDLQRAYRIGDGANLTLPLRKVFPNGLPDQFSVIGTFNAHNQDRPWSLIRARSQTLQFSLTLLPKAKRLVVFVQGSKAVFFTPELFRSGWHKIHVAITNDTVYAAVDCVEINFPLHPVKELLKAIKNAVSGLVGVLTSLRLVPGCRVSMQQHRVQKEFAGAAQRYLLKKLEPESISPHAFTNATSITIITNDEGKPAPIDLQWLSLSCNRYNLKEDNCEEIDKNIPEQLIATFPPLLPGNQILEPICNQTCPPGPEGLPGAKGEQGPRGYTGLPGVRGVSGPPGSVGPLGPKGEKGERGLAGTFDNVTLVSGPPGKPGQRGGKGDKGDQGLKGEPGEAGLVGLAGVPGLDGKDGMPGRPGPMGLKGEPGPIGPPGPAPNINFSLSHGAKGEKGSPGKPGRDGDPGLRGPPGNTGLAGIPGLQGPPGVPGIAGERGLPGTQGTPGERGPEGPQGPEGQRGSPGPPGPPGATTSASSESVPGPPGPPGEKGQNGVPGIPGFPGKDGLNGIPGPPGAQGPPGAPAPNSITVESPSLSEGDVRNICEDLIRARFQELSASLIASTVAPSVRRGAPGRPGPPGAPGIPGEPGTMGPRGYPGETGEPGRPGSEGPRGDKGDKGERGADGVGIPGPEGPGGRPGPAGPPGPEGRTGPRGDSGREGPIGPRGFPGLRGSCDCPVAYYAYAPVGNNKGP